jgi:PleD family two-component response regulator
VGVTASFGVAAFPVTLSADELMNSADRALYRAKREGKNRVSVSSRHPAE